MYPFPAVPPSPKDFADKASEPPGFHNGYYDPGDPNAVPIIVDEYGNRVETYTPSNVKTESRGNPFIPPTRLTLPDTQRYRTPEQRLKYFADAGRFFTNNEITESRDDSLNTDEFVYPVFRISEEFSKLNPERLLFNTYYNKRYGKYFPLNKYKARLAAKLNFNTFTNPQRPNNIDAWYDYAWYIVDARRTGDFTFPVRPITPKEFSDNLSGADLVIEETIQLTGEAVSEVAHAVINLPIEYQVAGVLIAAAVGGGIVGGITENPKAGIITGIIIAVGGMASIGVIDAGDKIRKAVE